MKITRSQLRTDLPPVLTAKEGACNVVLALYRPEYNPKAGSPWQTTNTEFYRKNRAQFVGWIEIEHPGYFPNTTCSQPRKQGNE